MGKNASPKPDNTPQTSSEAPFTTFIQLDGKSPVPSQFRTPVTFTITRLQSPAGLPDRITTLSPVPALLVSISFKSLPRSSCLVWTADKFIATSIVHPLAPMSSISIHSQGARRLCLRLRSLFCCSQRPRCCHLSGGHAAQHARTLY